MVIDGPNWRCKVCGDKKPIEEKKIESNREGRTPNPPRRKDRDY